MPALWQASERPMYVRTVWVNGFRHAILSKDDPYLVHSRKKRPYSSANWKEIKPTNRRSRLSNHSDGLEDCLKKINLIIRKGKPKVSAKGGSLKPEVEELNLIDIETDSEEEFELKGLPQPLSAIQSNYSKYNNSSFEMRTMKSNRTEGSDTKENTDLSDRVLQWLDLAGKVDLLAPENVERMTQPRHSWPEIQKRNLNLTKSKTILDLRGKESKTQSPKAGDRIQQTGNIDRHDFYVPTAANTIETYARQSRNLKSTSRNEINTKAKEQSHKMKSKDVRANVLEARHKVVAERSAVEKQYADLVSRKIIPDVNKGIKRQVHIFMPDVPKKLGSTLSSRTSSVLN